MAFYREKLFPALAGLLWGTFLLLDVTGRGGSLPIKFAAICLCALTAWTGARSADGLLIAVALTFTVGADVFLLLLDRGYPDRVTGLCLFIPVQLLYAFRLYRRRGSAPCPLGCTLRGLGAAAALLLLRLDGLCALACVYFSNLAVNTGQAFSLKDDKLSTRFAWGLLLFVGCDLCVGCWNLGLLGELARVGMWLFYLPSQVLIVLSQDTKEM